MKEFPNRLVPAPAVDPAGNSTRTPTGSITRTIACTPANAAHMQQVVKHWPELHSLVQDLQEQDLFPGLRGLRVTLTGAPEQVALGLDALAPKKPTRAV